MSNVYPMIDDIHSKTIVTHIQHPSLHTLASSFPSSTILQYH